MGALAGYLFLTDGGRRVRREVESALVDFSRDILSFQDAAQQAFGAAHEGWRLVEDMLGRGEETGSYPYPRGWARPASSQAYR